MNILSLFLCWWLSSLCFHLHVASASVFVLESLLSFITAPVTEFRAQLCTKVHLVKAMVFPVVMYGCDCWITMKAECQRIDAFELWCCRRLLRVPWTWRRSNQSILKEIGPGYSLEGLMLKLKLQYFGRLMWRADSFENTLMLGKTEGGREKGTTEDEMVGWHHRQWTWVWVDSRS